MSALPPDRTPPSDNLAERALLSAMLRDVQLPPDVVPLVRAEDFYLFAHQLVFAAIMELCGQGKNADIITVSEVLTKRKQLDDAGGVDYLVELWDAAPSAASYRYYAEIIRNKAKVRSLIRLGHEVAALASTPGADPDQVLENAERSILDIAERSVTNETVPVEVAVTEAYERLDARSRHQNSNSVPTGFLDLDSLLAGFQNSELILLAARPSVGKTALSLAFAAHAVLEEGMPVLFVSLEQARVELAERLLCSTGRVDGHTYRKPWRLTLEERERIANAGNRLRDAKDFYINDRPGQSMLQISANARRLHRRHGIRMVIIDYLQLIDPESTKVNRNEQVSGISRRLKFLARELKVPVLALSQLNRSSEDGTNPRKPRLSDLRDSGSLEQDADTVLLLHRPDRDSNLIECEVAKQRNGPTGEAKLFYQKQFMLFQNFAVEHQAYQPR